MLKVLNRRLCTAKRALPQEFWEVNGKRYECDHYCNVTSKILAYIGRNLYMQKDHPLKLVRDKIVEHFYKTFPNTRGNPAFAVVENLDPVVSVEQNFDSLLIPQNHPSRAKSDCYYLNSEFLLRGHATAHQVDLIKSGLDNFLVIGDVYRRDAIDSTHFPVFHQVDGVRLFSKSDLGGAEDAPVALEYELKATLLGLAKGIMGRDAEVRWVEAEFPFTHPSWELEVKRPSEDWLELLGCGIIRPEILQAAGAAEKAGWAFGLGLERIAMHLFAIPDIRLFWSTDSGFLGQFRQPGPHKYKPISIYPQCRNDISFWLPEGREFSPNDFYDLVRSVAGDMAEQVELKDDFMHPKTKRRSHCYAIVYRSMTKTLTQAEVNEVHKSLEAAAVATLGVAMR